jgi:hypothetical protein
MRNQVNSALCLVVLPLLILVGCSADTADEPTSNELLQRARNECRDVAHQNRAICEESIQRLALDFNLYRVSERNFAERTQERRELVSGYRAAANRQCSAGDREACDRVRVAQAEMAKIEALMRQPPSRQRDAEERYQRAVAALPAVVNKRSNRVSVICKVLHGGRVACLRLSTILAYYDSELNEALLSDIDRLLDVYGIDPRAEILMACGPGVWGGATLGEFAATSPADFLSNLQTDLSTSQETLDKCGLIQAATGNGGGQTGAGGFSGMTGFDPWHGSSACGFDITGGVTLESVIEAFAEMSELFRAECGTEPWETVASGGDDPGGDPGTDPGTDPGADAGDDASLEETTTDNGDGTETVCTQYGCYVRYKDPSSASSTATEADLNTSCTDDGTCTTEVSGLDENNEPMSVKEILHPDGTREIIISNDVSVYGIEAPDGNRYIMVCKGSLCRDAAAAPGEDLPDPWKMTWEEYEDWMEWLEQQQNIGVGDCIDGPCMSCSDYSEFMWDLKQGCANFGSSSEGCQSYMREAECCSNPDAFPADPRVLMPNPDGNLACYGELDQDFQTEMCNQRCSVASHEDCNANCLSTTPAQIEFDMMAAICTMAISESCFYGTSGLAGGGGAGPIGGGTPLPIQMMSHRTLPIVNVLKGCDAGIVGCGEVRERF